MNINKKPSDAETAILRVLWQHQPCSVKTVHEILSATKDVGYTTTLKQIQRMLDKGLVERQQGKGKSYDYTAAVTETDTKAHLFDRFVETAFGDSVSDLVMHALGNADTSEEELRKIKGFIKKLEADNED